MNNKILDYSECVRERFEKGISLWVNPHKYEPFFGQSGWCPYCKRWGSRAFNLERKTIPSRIESDNSKLISTHSIVVWCCEVCGWWDMEDCISKSPNSGRPLSLDAIRYHGVLKSYDTSDSQIPIEFLRQTLRKNENIVHKIDPYLFEKLVGSVMRDFYANCVVNFCGRSGDGGIDLFLIESDKTIAIQVKRRIHPNSVERIQAVREFLGASLAQGIDHLIYVIDPRK